MPRFAYRALDPAGASVTGSLDAPDRRAALRALRERGLSPLSVNEGDEPEQDGERAKPAAPVALGKRPALGTHPAARKFFQKLQRLTSGGLPPGDAVRLLATRTGDPVLRKLSEGVWRDLAEGRTLAESVRRFPDVFEPGEAGLIEAGESSGTLAPALTRLLALQAARDELRKKLTAALAYPTLVCGLAGVTIAMFVFHLLPKLEGMMRSLNAEFSGASFALITIARASVYGLPILAVATVAGLARINTLRATSEGRRRTDAVLLRLPLAGPIVRHAETSGFTGLLGTLLASGISATEALRLAEKPVSNEVIRRKLADARGQINEGVSFSAAFRRHGLLDEADLDILTVNETTGTLHAAFDEIAKAHFADLDAALRRLVNVLSGVFLGAAFAIVFFCLVSVVLSVLQVSQGIAG